MFPLSLCLFPLFATVMARSTIFTVQESTEGAIQDVKVPVQLGVMSRCPDALLCEGLFDQVLAQTSVSQITDLSLVYVANIDPNESHYGVTCKHGVIECRGNVEQLCVKKHAPSFGAFWEFVQCQNFQGKDNIGTPETAQKCAASSKLDWQGSGIESCVEGDEGRQLLQDSVKAGKALNITKSCTVVINGVQVCIHDSTWKHCENGHEATDFARQIKAEYDRLNAGE